MDWTEILKIGLATSALVIATAHLATKVVAREWFRAKRQYMHEVMNECMSEHATEES